MLHYQNITLGQARETRTQFWLFFLCHKVLIMGAISLLYGAFIFYHIWQVVEVYQQHINNLEQIEFTSLITPGQIIFIVLVSLFYFFLWLVNLCLSITAYIRRLHDAGFSGWWVLLGIIAPLVLLIFLVLPSKKEYNAYYTYPELS